jgi:UDP-3-O-[3-hydroxymyristoyl] glucosamine N-acyltransferase
VLGKYEVLGNMQSLQEIQSKVSVVIAFGNPKMRKKCWDALQENANIHFPNIIHSTAVIMNAERIQLGKGVIIFPLAVLTTDLSIGDNVVVHTGASVHHDVSVGNHSVIMPGARLVMSEQLSEASFIESNYFKPHSF